MQRLNMLPEGIRSDVLKQISEQDQINNSEQLVTDSLRESARTEGASKDKSEKVFGQDFLVIPLLVPHHLVIYQLNQLLFYLREIS